MINGNSSQPVCKMYFVTFCNLCWIFILGLGLYLLILFFVTSFLVYQLHKTVTQGRSSAKSQRDGVAVLCTHIEGETEAILTSGSSESLMLSIFFSYMMLMKSIY